MGVLNYNKVFLAGRLTNEPELKQTQDGTPVASFGLAVNRIVPKGSEKVTDFFTCRAWRTTGQNIARFFHKGNSIFISGTLNCDKYTDTSGIKRTEYRIVVDEFRFVDGMSAMDGTTGGNNVSNVNNDASSNSELPQNFGDDLPF